MPVHYYTSENKILCGQKHKNPISAHSRFSFKLGESGNCKNCEKILMKTQENTSNKCVSFEQLGYKTECQWRNDVKCNCIDDCNFKRVIC